MKLKINKDFGGYTKGQVVTVACDPTGIPILQYWRNRLRDSSHDNCVSVVKSTLKKKPQTDDNSQEQGQ